jgi:putative flippase GtrA
LTLPAASISGQLRELFRFSLVGALGFVVATAILYTLMAIGTGFYGGYALAFFATVTLTWRLNRGFTFADRSAGLLRQWAHFTVSNAIAGIFNYAAFAGLIAASATAREVPILATAAGAVAGLAVNFLAAKRFVFTDRPAAAG